MNKPAFKYKMGAVHGTVWRNEKDGKQWYSTQIQRVYKVGNDWKYTDSMMTNSLHDMVLVVQRCYTWIKTEGAQSPKAANSDSDTN